MSRAGEIRNLTKLIKPDIGIITNIGEAHIQNFNSKDDRKFNKTFQGVHQ